MERMRRMRRVSPSPSPTPSPSPSLLMWVWQRSPEERNQGTSGQLWEKTQHGKGPGHLDPALGGLRGSGSFRSPAGFPGSFPEVGRRWESQPHVHGLGSRVGVWGSRVGVLEDKEWVLGSKVGGWRSRVGCGDQKLGFGSQGLGVEGQNWVWGTEVGICRARVGFWGTKIGFWGVRSWDLKISDWILEGKGWGLGLKSWNLGSRIGDGVRSRDRAWGGGKGWVPTLRPEPDLGWDGAGFNTRPWLSDSVGQLGTDRWGKIWGERPRFGGKVGRAALTSSGARPASPGTARCRSRWCRGR